jgi:transcriptional regulator with PAS, ATPase and Fis domain
VDVSVLILGETGTGKELVSRAIHERSNVSDGPFVAVNAPAIPHELIESTLFGHEKGAFTGASDQRIGACEQAADGTLFLDEISEMDYDVQAKLLRFCQDHVVQRVGAKTGREVNVRVLAATNREPEAMIREGKLREDLYYRLNVVTIPVPPLRERAGDIPLLAQYFLDRAAEQYSKSMHRISDRAMERIAGFNWPGNVRQLEHVIQQAVVTSEGEQLEDQMLPAEVKRSESPESEAPEDRTYSLEEMEQRMIRDALNEFDNNVQLAAQRLGVSEATIYRKIKKYGL